MAERGVEVDHATLNRWVVKFSPSIAENAQAKPLILCCQSDASPRGYPPGTCRMFSGSHIAISGQTTRITTISNISPTIGTAVLAM